MNNIGFGIFCFGDEYYHRGAQKLMDKIISKKFRCYILTDKPDFFRYEYGHKYIIPFTRSYKSYYDKLELVKHILDEHRTCVLIDSDAHFVDDSFLYDLKKFNFKDGISYVHSLKCHPSGKEFVKELDMNLPEWKCYAEYAQKIYPSFMELETIWEYFLVFNKKGFNQSEFFKNYEKLQIVKEYSDILVNKEIGGNGEGISIAIASKLSDTPIEKDTELSCLIGDNIINVSRRFTPPHLWPDFLK